MIRAKSVLTEDGLGSGSLRWSVFERAVGLDGGARTTVVSA